MKEFNEEARTGLKKGLARCTPTQCGLFLRRFGIDPKTDINESIDQIPEDELVCAVVQLTNMLIHGDK